ncbi:hypothetical protein VZC37_21695 [Gordonia sp. LSe1-13]|uniref:DUF2798 domain-containing protein n=1 Tax=Gordonia sesuvii TaxID=3116777 RepID=A0ABU7MK78_9ACTN|nr:hypothetical protein [Gordonia sp. LSe1-13]
MSESGVTKSTNQRRAYFRRETAISIAINTAMSFLFFLLVFGFGEPMQVWGLGNYVFDFVPQGFAIALMATLVPGAKISKALREGRLARGTGRSRLPARLWQRALVLALVSAFVGTALAAVVMSLVGSSELSVGVALAGKLVFGAVLAAVITPVGMRAALSAETAPIGAPVSRAQSS